MAKGDREPYWCETLPFVLDGEEQFVEVTGYAQRVRRCRWPSREVIEETEWPVTYHGCYIHAVVASPSGNWLVTQRISGQGEWGYDVFRTRPLAQVAGVAEEKGYILDLPAFSPDESCLVGGAGRGFMGGWWTHADDDVDDPPRSGVVSLGFLFVHRLPSHEVSRHELQVNLPPGCQPEDPWSEWYGPREITPTADGVRFLPSWGISVVLRWPLPPVIMLPVPHPSGSGLFRDA